MQNGHLGFVLSKTREGKLISYFCDLIVFENNRFQNFSVHTELQSRLCFCDGGGGQ